MTEQGDANQPEHHKATGKERLVIGASSLGAVFVGVFRLPETYKRDMDA